MHIPVLLHEVIEYLNLTSLPAGRQVPKEVIDATLDGGGHTLAILEQFPDIRVLGIEYDPVEYKEFKSNVESLTSKSRLITVNDSYVEMQAIAKANDFHPDGVLFDFGVSSWHYAASGRGFSFQKNEVLDMRFNPSVQTRTAADLVNLESQEELERILAELGEEQFSKQISRAIVYTRQDKPILMTDDLVGLIRGAVPSWYRHKKINPATKTFQALRMAVNDELGNIRAGLEAAIEVTRPGGRIVAISFHGLEDKTVREVFNREAKAGRIRWVTKDTIKPKWAEVSKNPRARSAKMKIAEKIL